jgi:hypothetical protein
MSRELYQLLTPIALFPDNLGALVQGGLHISRSDHSGEELPATKWQPAGSAVAAGPQPGALGCKRESVDHAFPMYDPDIKESNLELGPWAMPSSMTSKM